MRKLTYFIAVMADGYIARDDGSLDFFTMTGEHLPYIVKEYPETIAGHLRPALGVQRGNRHFDSVVMGRRTYEVGVSVGVASPYPHLWCDRCASDCTSHCRLSPPNQRLHPTAA